MRVPVLGQLIGEPLVFATFHGENIKEVDIRELSR
jgi:hypothetical protein